MIYFIRSGDHIKIGYSAAPSKRLSKISSDNPLSCELLGVIEGSERKEAEIHLLFSSYRVRGEWFQACDAISKYVAENTYVPVFEVAEDKSALGRFIKENSLTDAAFGERAGLSQSQVSRIRRGISWPSRDAVDAILKATDGKVTAHDLYEAQEAAQ